MALLTVSKSHSIDTLWCSDFMASHAHGMFFLHPALHCLNLVQLVPTINGYKRLVGGEVSEVPY